MSICRLSSCLSAKEMGKRKQCKVKRKLIKNKVRGFSTERSSKPPSSDSADVIVLEIEVSQSCALREDSCKALCPSIGDLIALPSPRRVFPTAHNKNLHPERWEYLLCVCLCVCVCVCVWYLFNTCIYLYVYDPNSRVGGYRCVSKHSTQQG